MFVGDIEKSSSHDHNIFDELHDKYENVWEQWRANNVVNE